jgi:hypothetical protein
MDIQDFKTKLIKLRNSIQDYLDQLDMDEVDEKPEKGEKKPEPKGSDKADPEETTEGKKEH